MAPRCNRVLDSLASVAFGVHMIWVNANPLNNTELNVSWGRIEFKAIFNDVTLFTPIQMCAKIDKMKGKGIFSAKT